MTKKATTKSLNAGVQKKWWLGIWAHAWEHVKHELKNTMNMTNMTNKKMKNTRKQTHHHCHCPPSWIMTTIDAIFHHCHRPHWTPTKNNKLIIRQQLGDECENTTMFELNTKAKAQRTQWPRIEHQSGTIKNMTTIRKQQTMNKGQKPMYLD